MEVINHKCYVSLEVAKLLKEAGFDWETKHRWDYCKPIDEWSLTNYPEEPVNWNSKHYNYDCSAPNLEVAQRWLREVKEIEVNVLCVYIDHIKKYSYTIFTNEYKHEIIDEGFDTYEEALETGIKKALELILEKGE